MKTKTQCTETFSYFKNTPKDRSHVNHLFYKYFDENFDDFYDSRSSIGMGYLCIDVIKFDIYLHNKFNIYSFENKTMKDIVIEIYGEKVGKFIQKLI